MKILNLKFKNINSLSGENEIDFTNPVFTNDGLFAITGKTGAGKSSILDAISLAFYGKTPRVDITGSENAVMTKGEKDCFAEITFEVAGKKWKSSWKQELNRNGNLKPVNRIIADFEDKIIADQVRSCDAEIIKILGLTFEQFTKVIMLAQGSFAAFLQADKNDKGQLLEQITGTEIYAEISKIVFGRNRTEKEKLDKISFELESIKILSDEEIENLTNENTVIEKEKLQVDEELQKIEKAKKWLSDVSNLQTQINQAKEKLPELEEKFESAEKWATDNKKYEELVSKFAAIEQENSLLTIAENDIKKLNKEITDFKRDDLDPKKEAAKKANENFEDINTKLIEITGKLETQKTELTELLGRKELSELQTEKETIINFGTQIKNLIEVEGAIDVCRRKIQGFEDTINKFYGLNENLSNKIKDDSENLKNLNDKIVLLEDNIKLINKIQSLEEHRIQLQDGKECPLCGAMEHPFAIGNVPQIGEKENELATLKGQYKQKNDTIQTDNEARVTLISNKDNAIKNKEGETKSLSQNIEKQTETLAEIKKLQPDFILVDDETKLETLNNIRQQKQDEYKVVNDIITKANDIENLIKKLRDEEIPTLQNEKNIAEQTKTTADTNQKLAEQQLNSKQDSVADKQNNYDANNVAFVEKLKNYGVENIEALKKCLDAWTENKKQMDDLILKLAANRAIVAEKENELSKTQEQTVTEKTNEQLQSEFGENKLKADEFSQKIGANKQTLKSNADNLKTSGSKLKEKEKQQAICNKWGKLSELIGSSDGKKYRNFAQALTFEHLIGLSNRQLQKMSDRYTLKRTGDTTNPFELSVIDKFQNNDERTAQNLSGGEKFIISLSLALGLANMASKNMRIDTMFIDEGFGTLDSDYLDVALNALSNLQSEGKVIGVISHLTELKERIATHVEVVPSGNGHSKIQITN